jgi:hypothetical protein
MAFLTKGALRLCLKASLEGWLAQRRPVAKENRKVGHHPDLAFSIMRVLLIVIGLATVFYSMTALVYFEGSFDGALVVKPYPMYATVFGGGEDGTWGRRHPGQPLPWFMEKDLRVISRFSWEEGGDPVWVTAYELGFLATFLAWLALPFIGAVRLLIWVRARNNLTPLSIR